MRLLLFTVPRGGVRSFQLEGLRQDAVFQLIGGCGIERKAAASGDAAALRDLIVVRTVAKAVAAVFIRGELLARLGRPDEAPAEFARAVARCANDRERALLEGKIAALG